MNLGHILRHLKRYSTLTVASVVAVILCQMLGCAAIKPVIKPDPAPDAGFIQNPQDLAPWPERAAFVQRIWFKDRPQFYATRNRFTKICFKPTRTDFLGLPGWWDKLNSGGRKLYLKDVGSMAGYVDATMRDVFRDDPLKRFEVADKPDEHTIVYEIAIVELRPTKVAINMCSAILGIFFPYTVFTPVVVKTRGSIAVEVTARDGANNDLLVEWADRRLDLITPCSIRDFEQYGHARRAVEGWATNMLKAWNSPESVVIEDSLPISLNPL